MTFFNAHSSTANATSVAGEGRMTVNGMTIAAARSGGVSSYIYDTVNAHEATLRSLVTIPIGNTRKLPAILFVQGFDCSSIEWPLAQPNLNRELVYRLNMGVDEGAHLNAPSSLSGRPASEQASSARRR